MDKARQVYLLDPKCLRPEVIAVAFAKTSRSPQSFREIAEELTDEKSAEFHERWVVGYGHASVAEHAVLHIAVENISRLAVETLESNRLASYTEKSSRYQKWNPGDYYIPTELTDPALMPIYTETCRLLFDTYQRSLPAVREVIEAQNPRQNGESDAAWERRIRSDYIDVCRFILPAAALANVGMTINARALEHAITKMLSNPLIEVNELGREIRAVAQKETPTLVKYADESPYLIETYQVFTSLAQRIVLDPPGGSDWCRLISHDIGAEDRILASTIFKHGFIDYAQALLFIQSLNSTEKHRLAGQILGNASKFEPASRELEHSNFTFELTLDQGAYFELKRHRMMTQTPQALTTLLGYAVPRAIVEARLEGSYRRAMDAANQAFSLISRFNPAAASYIVPNAYNRRVLLSFNLRTANHFLELRSAVNAHFSIRRAALRIAEQIRSASPLLGLYLHLPEGESWQQVEERYFLQTS